MVRIQPGKSSLACASGTSSPQICLQYADMGNLIDNHDKEEIVRRIGSLSPESKPQWGSMTAGQMICHVADPIRAVLGTRETPSKVPFFLKPIVKWRLLKKPRRRNSPTLRLFRQGSKGEGTRPTRFESDRSALLDLIDTLCSKDADFVFHHPAAGTLTREEAGTIVWGHLDHHLAQFGIR